jgi:hypothetical protein
MLRSLVSIDAGDDLSLSESVVGPCPDTVITAAHRPKLLVRGSVHPAVRDAQRRMNAFSRAEVSASRPPLSDTPLREDCVFGPATQRALISFQQRVFPGVLAEHDGRLGPKTWAEFDRVAAAPPGPLPPVPAPPVPVPVFVPPAPPSPTMTGPRAISRPCCMLAGLSLAGHNTVGGHGAGQPGIVYTGRAGFVDFGHLWEVADITAFAYQQIHAASGASGTTVSAAEGTATLTSAAPPADWLTLARCIAFDDAMGHEIATYTVMSPGGHNSSFSPEDLCSNFLGTEVAARALTVGGTFVTEAETQARLLLASLDAQTEAETRASFARIATRWVDNTLVGTVVRDGYLRRRNFTRDPWKTGHRSDAATPAFVVAPLGVATTYTYAHPNGFSRVDFSTRIAAIKADAATRYGAGSDRP